MAPVVACSSTTRNNVDHDDTGAAGETSTSSSSDGELSAGGSGGSGDGSTTSGGGTAQSESGGTSGTGGGSSDNSSGGAGDSSGGGGTTDTTNGGAGGTGGGTTDGTASGGAGGGTADSTSSGGTSSTTDGTTSGGAGGGTTDSTSSGGTSSTTDSTSSGGTSSTTSASTTGSSCAGSDTCTSECPCSTGEGACSNDDQCDAGLVCTTAAVAKLGFTGGAKSCMPVHCDNDALDDDLGETSQDCGGECGCRATYEDIEFEGVPADTDHITFDDMSGDGSTLVGIALAVNRDPSSLPVTISASGAVTLLENHGVYGIAEFVNNDGSIVAGRLSCDDPPNCATDDPTVPVRWVNDAAPVTYPFESPVLGMSASGNVVVYTEQITDPDRPYRLVVSTGSSTYSPELADVYGISGNGAVVYGSRLDTGRLGVWYTATDEVWTPPVPSEWVGARQITAMSTDGSVFVGEGMVWIDISNTDYTPFISQDQSFELVDIVDDRLVDVRPRDLSADGTRFVGTGYNEDTGVEEGVFWDEAGGVRTLYDELVARGLEFPIDVTEIGPASFISGNGRIIVSAGTGDLLPFWRVVLSD